MVGSIRSLRSALNRARVRSSSAPARRLNPTTSAARIAAIFRVSVIARPSAAVRIAQNEPMGPSRSAQIERPGLPDEVVAEGMVRRFADEAKPRRLIDAARGDQDVVGPQRELAIAE